MSQSPIPPLDCMCASFRRSSRALSQYYDVALRPTGLRATQFTILQALSIAGEVSQGRLAQILAIDSTTLTRTLAIMTRHGWIAKRRGGDRRQRRLRLTPVGKRQLNHALPHWEKVQTRLRRKLGPQRWDTLLHLTNQVTSAVTAQGAPHD